MYKELTIKNLKIFKEEQKLKIAPITLLYSETKPTITMSRYDHINNKFLDHYECTVVKSYIN